MRINIDRLKSNLAALSQIGRTPEGGVSRPSFSQADVKARQWFIQKLKETGLAAAVDAAGNIFGRLDGKGPAVISGSHLDTIINGGFYDGAAGVLCALECINTIKEKGIKVKAPLEVVSFADEEEWFYGFLGSYALTGQLKDAALDKVHDKNGQSLATAMRRADLDLALIEQAQRPRNDIKAFVELHIEQGPLLEQTGHGIGVVDSVKGDYRYGITFKGQRNHAGSPMPGRRDAMRAAVQLINYMYTQLDAIESPDVLLTVGAIQADPSLETVIPASVYFSIDFRAPAKDILLKLSDRLHHEAKRLAEVGSLELTMEPLMIIDPVLFDDGVLEAIRQAAIGLDLNWCHISSGAGHDGQVLGRYVSSAMIFVPSQGGRSHCPEEHTTDEHIEAGANVLLHTLVQLANQ
ncbi:MAG: Zn-dependent hydrolase [Desulfobacterales bacterium]|nr:MAG: Zn-dependent hydrolase [Desulfobacterales bacterium]